MTNRNSASPVPQAPRITWPYRHRRLFGVLVVSGILGVSTGLAASIKIEVRVPLIVPLFAAGALLLLLDHAWQSFRAEQHAARRPIKLALTGRDDALIGRVERDAVLDLLAARYATEHFDEDEYGRRHTMAINARYRHELRHAVRGLSW